MQCALGEGRNAEWAECRTHFRAESINQSIFIPNTGMIEQKRKRGITYRSILLYFFYISMSIFETGRGGCRMQINLSQSITEQNNPLAKIFSDV